MSYIPKRKFANCFLSIFENSKIDFWAFRLFENWVSSISTKTEVYNSGTKSVSISVSIRTKSVSISVLPLCSYCKTVSYCTAAPCAGKHLSRLDKARLTCVRISGPRVYQLVCYLCAHNAWLCLTVLQRSAQGSISVDYPQGCPALVIVG